MKKSDFEQFIGRKMYAVSPKWQKTAEGKIICSCEKCVYSGTVTRVCAEKDENGMIDVLVDIHVNGCIIARDEKPFSFYVKNARLGYLAFNGYSKAQAKCQECNQRESKSTKNKGGNVRE